MLRAIVLFSLVITLPACSLFTQNIEEPLPSGTAFNWQETQTLLEQLDNWQLLGKVNIRSPEESVTAAVNKWHQRGTVYDIDLSSTFLGLGATNIKGSDLVVTLTESGEPPIISDQPNLLIAESLGLPLPITHLAYWIKGVPNPNNTSDVILNSRGLPSTITQSDWTIQYSSYYFDQTLPLPKKIKLSRDNIKITLAIKQWTLP